MDIELLNFIVVAIGFVITIMINWDRLQKTPRWMISFVIGGFVGFAIGYVV